MMSGNRETDSRRGETPLRHTRVARTRGLARVGVTILATLFTSALLVSCTPDRIAAPNQRPDSLSLMPTTRVNVVDGDIDNAIPVQGVEENQCNEAEVVPYRGKISYALFVSALDVTHFRTQWHFVFDGTGSYGNVYHGAEEFIEESNSSIFPFEYSNERNVRMVSPTAPDMYIKYHFHFTIVGPPLRMTAFVEKGNPFVGECK